MVVPSILAWLKNRNCSQRVMRHRVSVLQGGLCDWLLEDRLVLAAPTVINPMATAVTPLTAVLGGNMTSDGGNVAIQRGVVYALTSDNPNPTIGGPGVHQVNTPPEVPYGAFAVTVGALLPNSNYSFKAFAVNNNDPNEIGYSVVGTFSTSSGIVMPSSTVNPTSPTDYAEANKVLFFQPTDGMKLLRPDGTEYLVPQIPEKQLTLTNNLSHTVYPFMRDAAATIDPKAKADYGVYQGLYDPIDQLNEEYRGYIGYQIEGVNYLGLLPGMTITVSVPLVFWDGARMEIATDGTYLVNDAKVGAAPAEPVPNPFQYYRYNTDGSETARVALPALSVSGVPTGTTGMVMWYRQGLNNQVDRTQEPAQQAKAPAGDAPSQLIEWTMRDPVLSLLNPNIDLLHPNFGETHANINYDVSYVDNMALPVAMAALDVPVPVQTVPPLDPRNPNPGPRLPYGWIGAAQSFEEFQRAITDFTADDPAINGLGDYFGGQGWPSYYLPANRFPGGTVPLKIPSGQDVISDSPLARHTTSYDAPISNHFILTSGGTDNFSLVGAGSAYSDGTTTLRLLASTPALQQILQEQLHVGMVVAKSAGSTGPDVLSGTRVLSIGPVDNPGFHFTEYQSNTVLEVQLNSAIAASGEGAFPNPTYGYDLTRVTTDYVTTALVNLWYTWAKYYADHVSSPAQVTDVQGQSLTTDSDQSTNQIKLTQSATALGLVPGMLVTGSANSGIFALRPDQTGATTIESIDPVDPTIINLSQAVGISQVGATYSFFKPDMTSPAIHGFSEAVVLTNFTPTDNEVAGVPDVLKFAQFAYQMVSLMSQIPSEDQFAPISAQILHNVIGGNITKAPLNGDANHKTEVAYRDKIKSLLRGVNDFTVQTDQLNQWYPDPSLHKGGQTFNIYNLDPFVWFVHKRMGLSGYGFSLDDDAADISGNFSTRLGVAIGGLNGLPNHFEWSNAAPYGPVSALATVLSDLEVAALPPYSFFSVQPYNANEKIPGANISGEGVPAHTYLYSFGNGGLYAYSYLLSDQSPPSQNPLPPPPTPGPLQIPPLVVNGQSVFTILGSGTANGLPSTLPAGATTSAGPYMNTRNTVNIPAGSTLTITSLIGNLTSYTQQYEPMARVSMVATPDSQNGLATPQFVPNAPFPNLNTVVNGTLDAGRVEIVNGSLSGTGTIKGSINVFGPVSGYSDPIELTPVHGEPVDTGWNNPTNKIEGTQGGSLVAGNPGGTPGKLTVTQNVSLYNASLTIYAQGAATPGSDYSWLSSNGTVYLGNSTLDLSLIDYTPQTGHSLTIITAAEGVVGRFSQESSVRVNGFTFNITYNANNVVLTYAPALATSHLATALHRAAPSKPTPQDPHVEFVETLYRDVVKRPPRLAALNRWARMLRSGGSRHAVALAILTSSAHLRRHPNVTSFVRALYHNVLGRRPNLQSVAAWVDFARANPGDWVALTEAFLKSREARKELRERFDEALLS